MTHLEHNEGRIHFEDIMPIFGKVATMAELSKMDSDERRRYEDSEDLYLSNLAAWEYNYEQGHDKGWAKGRAKGRAEGLAEGRAKGEAIGEKKGHAKGLAEGKAKGLAEVAIAMKQQGIPVETIAACTKLSIEEVINLTSGR